MDIRGAPSDLREGGWAVFLGRIFFGSFEAARFFFWPMLAFFLVVALLHDFFSLLVCLARYFWVTAHPPLWRSEGPPLNSNHISISITIIFSLISIS